MAVPSSLLIIDDETGIRQSLTDLFTQEGVKYIHEAGSAEEGLEKLEKESFSLIICDYRLPGMTGIAFMGKLRMSGNRTPLLIISGVPNKDLVKHTTNGLKVGFLAKPFTITELISAVENLMDS